MRLALLAHDRFPSRAKTAQGLLRYGDHDIVAVIDRATAGSRVSDHLTDVQDAPIVDTIEAVPEADVLVVGIAPIGGTFDETWRSDIAGALARGSDVWSGLHQYLGTDEEFAQLAATHDCRIWDVRRPPEELTVSDGSARDIDATVVLTVGTDCSVGKMTTTMELVEAARDRGLDAGMVPTGQTGVMLDGDGIVIDRVVSDFAAGALERMLLDRAHHDYLFVEGQGSIVHPAYSGVTSSILHGTMADALVLCHEAGRDVIHGYESFSLPSVPEVVELYESLAGAFTPCSVVGGALNTAALDAADARDALETYENAIGAPATDPIRCGVEEIVTAIEEHP
ncbi:DUF1611 domain-containing protein [Halocatena pleomorpha]|uniref:DUF1611 domain-containing protein n=1 Tax=Halocatena pleomorpha TaxID=1785090 RepID=A0A3P3RJL7_9EURY|nr:DUF1611 domain-containing protein [Halocatena pleomorpha]RRJ33727.1 DUF1611 domain-containing protein [Halocatena pleomorpha]